MKHLSKMFEDRRAVSTEDGNLVRDCCKATDEENFLSSWTTEKKKLRSKTKGR